ncbi:MAG TPA: ribose-5-phosphate isomerase RpiA [Polyangiaceae bacterium]
MNASQLKQLAAAAAIAKLPRSGVIGLGSGSTAELFIRQLAELVRSGREYVGVPTSERSRELAQSLGIPLLENAGPWQIEVTVDGADEVSSDLALIKGGGGCQLQEKIVNDSSRVNIIIVDESKISPQLGMRSLVPVEVVPFGWAAVMQKLERFGSTTLRKRGDGPYVTDSGNYIVDLKTGAIADPDRLDIAIARVPGVVVTGLFVNRASCVIVAASRGISEMLRPN